MILLVSGGYLGLTGKVIYGCSMLKEKFSSMTMIKSVCVKKTSNVWILIFHNGCNWLSYLGNMKNQIGTQLKIKSN